MLDCKYMATLIDINLKLLSDETSELVDMNRQRHIIESLMYLMNTRPNMCFVVNTLTQYIVKPRWVHLIARKNVMRYLKGTIYLGLYYGRDRDYRLYGYMDLDWARSVANRKSTSCECYSMGFSMISQFSKKKSSFSRSIAKAKYMAA